METESRTELFEKWNRRAFLGPLPQGFLRMEETTPQQQQESADRQAALALHQMQMQNMPGYQEQQVGRLRITIVQAKLVKNYGMTRMDPYVRLRVGHGVYETQTDPNGAKYPHWNRNVQCYLPHGVTQIYIEIYDECSFVMDELIAWAHIDIPRKVLQQEMTHEDWYMLSGKQGDNQEGMIKLVLSYSSNCQPPYIGQPSAMMLPSATMYGLTQYAPINVYTAPTPAPAPVVVPSSLPNAEAELEQIAAMFPNIDKDVIKAVYDEKGGDKDVTVNNLLLMGE